MLWAKVLLVDDELAIRRSLMRVFAEAGYQIFSVASSEQALEILAEQDIQVVISDERMSGMSGTAFLKIVRERYPETIRIILTGHASLETAMAAINDGEIFRLLLKPWDDEELLATVRQGLERRAGLQAMTGDATGAQEKERKRLLSELKCQYPGINQIRRDKDGAILL